MAKQQKRIEYPLPAGILKSDLEYPKAKDWQHPTPDEQMAYDCCGQFELWYISSFGWVIPTLQISSGQHRYRPSSAPRRTYAICVKDGKGCRVGHGPHVKEIVTVYVRKSRVEALKVYIDLWAKGLEDAICSTLLRSHAASGGSEMKATRVNNRPPTGPQLTLLLACYPCGATYTQIREMRFASPYGACDPMALSAGLCKLLNNWPTAKPRKNGKEVDVNTRGWLTRQQIQLSPTKAAYFYELTPTGREVLETALRMESQYPKEMIRVWHSRLGVYATKKVAARFFRHRREMLQRALLNPMLPFQPIFNEPLIYADWIEDGRDGPHDSKLADIIRIVFARKK